MPVKKILLCSLMPLLVLTAVACSHSVEDEIIPNNLWTVTEGITLRLQQDSYPPNTSAMTLVLENRSDSVMMYGQGWSFEKYERGAWRTVEPRDNYGFTAEGYTLYGHDKNTFTIPTGFLKAPLSEVY